MAVKSILKKAPKESPKPKEPMKDAGKKFGKHGVSALSLSKLGKKK